MANIRLSVRNNDGEVDKTTVYEVSGKEKFAKKACEEFLDKYLKKPEPKYRMTSFKVADVPQAQGSPLREEVVAIYDNAGIPSFMYRITKKKDSELFDGGKNKTHPAFIIGGAEYDEIYISVYPNCQINGKPYSLPYMQPWVNITNDEAAKACFSKGKGWHLMTRPEWGLLANICKRNDTLPHGNTDYGKYYADNNEKGATFGDGRTLTGSGPATWTHNHKFNGIHDLCGDVWEEVRGFRIKDGILQRAKDNDGAMDIDLSEESREWVNVSADTGKPVRVSAGDEGITFTTREDMSKGWSCARWKDVNVECESEQLKELGLYPGEPDAYCYIDSTDGEYLPICGGYWDYGALAGVFYVNLNVTRSDSSASLGFRSAYFGKLNN